MTLYLKLPNFWVQLFPRLTKQKSLLEIAMAEGLDEFVEIESEKAGIVEYCTVHGYRIYSNARPELNLFVVLKKGNGFVSARSLPYIYGTNFRCQCPQLVVACNPTDAAATQAGYARAVPLPYNRYLPNSQYPRLASDLRPIPAAVYAAYAKATQLPDEAYLRFHSTCCFTVRIPNSLEVCVSSQNEEATSAGYANAVPIMMSRSDVYIEDMQMLDTDYAASLVDFPRFG